MYTVKGKAMNPEVVRGKSAYEIAVMHGFEGTEEEWLDSLVQDAKKDAEQIREDIEKEKAEAIKDIEKKRDELANTFYVSEFPYSKSLNLYDASKQTSDTISPHYYVSGAPYETTQFDTIYNRTALIEIQPSTTYTLALVPVTHVDYPLPWGRAEHGVFFYDENGEWITHSQISKATFTTPSNAKYLAFNYYKDSNDSKNTLDVLNSTCMLVLGDEAPTEYAEYGATITVEERLKNNLDRAIESTMPALYFSYNNVEELYVSAKYNNTHDAVYLLRREGGNKIFDFKKIGTIANADDLVSPNFEKATYFIGSSGDWHAPFQVLAVNNGDGDQVNNVYFTGGNHNYNNASDNDASATGRTAEVRVFANNKEVAIGSAGYANRLEVKWVNYVQGYNTTKQDGTGREILKERHTLSFDGRKWESSVELEALEDIKINLWYGFQCAGLSSVFSKVRYLGAKNRGVYSTDAASDCGDNETYHFEAYGDSHKLIMTVDPLFDLGKRKYCTNNKAVFATTYGKAYFSIINTPLTISGGETYCLKGSYEFCAMTNEFEGSGGSASYDYSVSGTWVFNDTVNVEAEVNQTINFTSYSSAYTRMAAFVATDGKQSVAYYGGSTAYCYNDAWASEIYKTVSFGSEEQEVSQEFYEWLTANATKQ